jgi:ubiquinone/menaquinone biosynthesis C-methylase UbiE
MPRRPLPVQRALAAVLAAALLAAAAPAHADQPTPAPSTSPFRATSDRKFDDVTYWSGVFDDPKRDAWQKPVELIAAFAIRPGSRVVDLGAGTGYFSRHLARAVGPEGFVYALETEPNLVAHLRTRAEREGTENVLPVLASFDNPRLPPGTIDLVLIVDTYHHIDHRRPYLARLRRVLAAGGRVAIVDWEKGDIPVGPEPSHKIAREQVVEEMQAAGFTLIDEPDVLPYQYELVFAVKRSR